MSENPIRNTGGVKYDGDKLRYDLIPVHALEEIAKVFTVGAKKYADRNWQKGILYTRLLAAQDRHQEAYKKGETVDAETGCHHQACVAWYSLVLMEFDKFLPEMDDRKDALKYGQEKPQGEMVFRVNSRRLPGTDEEWDKFVKKATDGRNTKADIWETTSKM